MQEINYPFYNEKCYFEELANGLKVYVFHKPEYTSSAVAFGTPYGALDIHQSFKGQHYDFNPGIAHFLEHKAFEVNGQDMIDEFANLGANVNAFTSYRETVYHFYMNGRDNFFKTLNLLLDMVQTFDISDASVAKEKPIIIEEISMYAERPLTKLLNETNKALYHNFPMKYDIGGDPASVNAITKEELDRCYALNYHPSNMIVSIVSFIDPKEIIDAIRVNQDAKGFTKQELAINDNKLEPKAVAAKEVSFEMDVQSAKYVYAIKLNLDEKDDKELVKIQYAIRFYLEICFSAMNPNYQLWRDENKINDFFGYEVEIENDFACILFFTEVGSAKELKALVDDVLKTYKLPLTKFEQLKRRYIGDFFDEFNDLDNYNITFIRNMLDGVNMFDIFEIINKLSYEDMISIMHSQDLSNYSLIELKPKNA